MRIAVVGNAKSAAGLGYLIDCHDFVVRFNRTQFYGWAGTRTDALILSSCGHTARQLVEGKRSVHPAILATAGEFWLSPHPFDPEQFRTVYSRDSHEDLSGEIVALLGNGKSVATIPAPIWFRTKATVDGMGARGDALPSSGAVALHYLLDRWPKAEINLFGFTHEGWAGHPWEAEKAWMRSLPNVRSLSWRVPGPLAREFWRRVSR